MTELAPLAGISRQRLYIYYKNIDEILYDLMENVLSHTSFIRSANTIQTDTPDQTIRRCILLFKDFSAEIHEDLLFLSLYAVYTATNKRIESKHEHTHILLFEEQICQGRNCGIFRTDKSIEELTAAVSHILAGYTFYCETLSREGRDQMLSDELLGRLADMVISYLKNE